MTVVGQRPVGEVGDGRGLEDPAQACPHRHPHHRELRGGAVVRHPAEALVADLGERSVHGPEDVGEGDLVGRAAEHEAAVGAPLAPDDAVPAELAHDVAQEVDRDVLGGGQLVRLDRPVPGDGQLGEGADGVVDLRGDTHGISLPPAAWPPATSRCGPAPFPMLCPTGRLTLSSQFQVSHLTIGETT